MTIILVSVFLIIASLAVGYIGGYEMGVKDTERRWSDAVGRKADRLHI